MRFEPDSGRYLLTAGYDNTSRLWGGPRFRLLRTLAGHEGKVMGADISPDGSFTVATTGYDRTIKVRSCAGGCLGEVKACCGSRPSMHVACHGAFFEPSKQSLCPVAPHCAALWP